MLNFEFVKFVIRLIGGGLAPTSQTLGPLLRSIGEVSLVDLAYYGHAGGDTSIENIKYEPEIYKCYLTLL